MLTKTQVQRLKTKFPFIVEIEDEGLDEGRFFIHINPSYDFCVDVCCIVRTKSFGSYTEAYKGLQRAKEL